jgi:hypothetical protein
MPVFEKRIGLPKFVIRQQQLAGEGKFTVRASKHFLYQYH